MGKADFSHTPVMLEACMQALAPKSGGVYVDGTLGGGGHAREILLRSSPDGRLIGIDRDPAALMAATERLQGFGDRFCAVHGNFVRAGELLDSLGIGPIDGVLLDLGASSHQFDTGSRGFSYNETAALDMRMDPGQALSAYDVVNGYDEKRLTDVIFRYGEERFARRIAQRIVQRREVALIEATTELAEIIRDAIPAATRRQGPHPARRTFQALRIEVNDELAPLEGALRTLAGRLKPGGVLCVITFHSLEDRIVKRAFLEMENPCTCPPDAPVCVCAKRPVAQRINRKPLVADGRELQENPRARSAKVRAVRRL